MSSWEITLTFDSKIKPKNGVYRLNSHVKEIPRMEVDLSSLFTGQGTTKLIKPIIGMGKDQVLQSKSSSGEWGFALTSFMGPEGFNKARSYFIGQIKSNIKKLKKSASKINLTLEA